MEPTSEPQVLKGPDKKYCTECGKLNSMRAEICPACGGRQLAPDNKSFFTRPFIRKRILLVLVFVLVPSGLFAGWFFWSTSYRYGCTGQVNEGRCSGFQVRLDKTSGALVVRLPGGGLGWTGEPPLCRPNETVMRSGKPGFGDSSCTPEAEITWGNFVSEGNPQP